MKEKLILSKEKKKIEIMVLATETWVTKTNMKLTWNTLCIKKIQSFIFLFSVSHCYLLHHHEAPPAQNSLTLSCHPSLSSIAPGRSSRLHPYISTELLYIGSSWWSCFCLFLWRGPQEHVAYELYLLLHQCPACLVRLTWIVFVMGGWWLHSCYFVRCCLQDLFNIACSILV